MATNIDSAYDELGLAISSVGPEYEGLLDYQKLNLKPDTRREVDEALSDYARRMQLMATTQDALAALISDGYPALATRAISGSAFEDLQENAASIAAALAKFSSNSVSSLTFSAGHPVPKE